MLGFRLIKFRTMTTVDDSATLQFEPGEKSRITKIGNVLRSTKIDELPELINVLKGDMSIVDPEHYYRHVILPDKLLLARKYTEEVSFRTDFHIIVETVKRIVGREEE